MDRQTAQRDEVREQRIGRLLAGAEDEYERISAWYGYLEEHLRFPFRATPRRAGASSGLRRQEHVEVIDLACVDDWEEGALVTLGGDQDGRDVPLAQLTPSPSSDEATRQAVADWHYWVERGYHFWIEDQE